MFIFAQNQRKCAMKKENFIKLYEDSFKNNFDLPALNDYGTQDAFTYGELAKEIEKLHILFAECKIQKGDKISVIGKNTTRWCIAYLATVTYGAVIVPILQDFNPNDVHHIVNHSESVLLFSSDQIWETLENEKLPKIKGSLSLTDFGIQYQKEGENLQTLTEQLENKFKEKYPNGFKPEDIKYTDISNDATVVLNYTSGTTGFSKGVMISGNNLSGNMTFAHEYIYLRRHDRMLSFLPLAHTYGSAFEFLYALSEGCDITLLGKIPSPKILLKAFQDVKPSLVIAVPLIIEKIYRKTILPVLEKKTTRLILKVPGLNSFFYSQIRKKLTDAFGGHFRQVIVGGAPLNNEVEDFLLKIKFPISVGYGMTECAPLISFSPCPVFVPHSCGKVLDCMEVRIDSSDPRQIAGEIQTKGQNVMLGYYKNDEATKDVFTEDGWLKTGDLGTIDQNNNIFIRGRLKSMILGASGQNIYPEEIEAKLENLPFVSESLVVERAQKLVALVYSDHEALKEAGISQSELDTIMEANKENLNNMVAGYEKISKIELVSSEFEKTPKKSIKRYLYQ